jgi:hypothetical protein
VQKTEALRPTEFEIQAFYTASKTIEDGNAQAEEEE